MRQLFDLDKKDYDPNAPRFVRPSVRGIIIHNGLVAMVHSLKYNYYKFPGGGIEGNESHLSTLLREVLEETGLHVIPSSANHHYPHSLLHTLALLWQDAIIQWI